MRLVPVFSVRVLPEALALFFWARGGDLRALATVGMGVGMGVGVGRGGVPCGGAIILVTPAF